MDFKVNRETLGVNEGVFDGVSEQAVELDYILPDYYPDIFKVLKCQMTPSIVSYNASGDKLTYDAVVMVRILYVGEENSAVQALEQRFAYSKTIDYNAGNNNPLVSLRPRTDYVNCRAVNQRRLDIRGAVSCRVKVNASRAQPLVADAGGKGVQVKKEQFLCSGPKLHAHRAFSVREEVPISSGKPDAAAILRTEANAQATDYKVIANKVIVKGNVNLSILYAAGENENATPENMQTSIPVSQILDLDGVNDGYTCFVAFDVGPLDVSVRMDENGESRSFAVEMTVTASCVAHKETELQLVTDAYSTDYACDFGMASVKVESVPTIVNESFVHKASVECGDGALACIYDAWGTLTNTSAKVSAPGEITVTGTLALSVLARTEEGNTVCLERSETFEHKLAVEGATPDSVFDPEVRVQSCTYSLAGTNAVEIRAEISVRGCLYTTKNVAAVSEIQIDENRPKEKVNTFALKLYFADKGEDIWNIAKRYSTSVGAILEENELERDVLPEKGMLLIPMV